MNERLLQFIWQFQYFNKQALRTSQGEQLVIEKPGTWNHHQGPDFSAATIRIGTTTWAGNIELHLRSSDWYRHRHNNDAHYTNIILHVVWHEDVIICDNYGNSVATLVLENRIARLLLERYRLMMETPLLIPCASFLPALSSLAWCAWKERLAVERLERKAAQVLTNLQQCRNHWEEVCWRLLTANFGMKVNAVLFEQVAVSLPVTVMAKHKSWLLQLEALLMGQANLLTNKYQDPYPILLQREYRFLQKKYQLQPVMTQPAFLRMRPAAFPTIRLAQLAQLLHHTRSFFSILLEMKEVKDVLQLFNVTASDYWNDHYLFDEPAGYSCKRLGSSMAENIVINTVAPLLFAYGIQQQQDACKERALQWLYRLHAEQHKITRHWNQAGVISCSALDSQALTELTNGYCSAKRCLECAVGNSVLKS